jgi:hypothetical protein
MTNRYAIRPLRGASLVGILVSIVIIGVLVALVLKGDIFGLGTPLPERPDKVGKTIIGRSGARARDVVCQSNIGQLRMAINMQRDQDNPPQSLADVPGLGADFKRCPIEPHEPYIYDPASGKVTCPHPGHEKF